MFPDKRKGQVYVYQSEDGLTHFCWKDRTSGVVEDVSIKSFYKWVSFRLIFINANVCF